MVVSADTVADPWTVMIHAKDAFVADLAVVNAWPFDQLALVAVGDLRQLLDLLRTS